MIYVVLGVDPGPTPGIVRLIIRDVGGKRVSDWADVVQCSAGALVPVLNALAVVSFQDALNGAKPALAMEAFVNGPRAARSSTPAAGKATRDAINDTANWAADLGLPIHLYRATDVKPWATDARLEAAGLLEITKGMRHARDGARHALFTAVKHYDLPDPLSGRAR